MDTLLISDDFFGYAKEIKRAMKRVDGKSSGFPTVLAPARPPRRVCAWLLGSPMQRRALISKKSFSAQLGGLRAQIKGDEAFTTKAESKCATWK